MRGKKRSARDRAEGASPHLMSTPFRSPASRGFSDDATFPECSKSTETTLTVHDLQAAPQI